MRWTDKLASKLGRLAVPNLTLWIVAGSGAFFLVGSFHRAALDTITLVPALVMQGEVWRILSFMIYPLDMSPFFAFFTYYLFYIMGTALEAEWGEAKFNLYIWMGAFWTIAGAFLTPNAPIQNSFLYGSVFLAFAYLYPEFELYIFFVIPVKIKYLAGITWIFYLFQLVVGSWPTRISILMSALNFLLFFGAEIADHVRGNARQMSRHAQEIREEETPFHLCAVCGLTEKKDPAMDFRVCSTCPGGLEYCQTHLRSHTHTPKTAESN